MIHALLPELASTLGAAVHSWGLALCPHPRSHPLGRRSIPSSGDRQLRPGTSQSSATVDQCLVGSWKSTQVVSVDNENGSSVPVVGSGGGILTIAADGTWTATTRARRRCQASSTAHLWQVLGAAARCSASRRRADTWTSSASSLPPRSHQYQSAAWSGMGRPGRPGRRVFPRRAIGPRSWSSVTPIGAAQPRPGLEKPAACRGG